MDKFTESEMAWRLWKQLDMLQSFLWERYEEAFIDFIDSEIKNAAESLPF